MLSSISANLGIQKGFCVAYQLPAGLPALKWLLHDSMGTCGLICGAVQIARGNASERGRRVTVYVRAIFLMVSIPVFLSLLT